MKRILIVDDEENIGRSLQMILEGEGYKVLVCRSAAEFRTRLAAYHPDACLVDVRLPDGNVRSPTDRPVKPPPAPKGAMGSTQGPRLIGALLAGLRYFGLSHSEINDCIMKNSVT